MSDLNELYQEMILDHKKRPRNFRALEGDGTCHADGHNPLCGDRITVFLEVEDDTVKEVAFQGNGCAISTASASMMTEAVKGRSIVDAHRLFHTFHALVMGQAAPGDAVALGKLEALLGVRAFPMRVKCATLAWHTLEAALAGAAAPVSTE
ncbi:MAG: Fe-S cluster assembly sulfur transfer protein SufU [Myxococcota bacterium]|jgi:nitrogen fixation NifU-like protein